MEKFRTFWNCAAMPAVEEAPMSEELITETAGYVPPEVRIKEMIQAGAALQAFRAENYDFPYGEEVPDDYFDPTRAHGYDQDDAFEDMRSGVASLKAKALAKKANEDLEGKKEADVAGAGDGDSDGKDA